MVRYFIFLFLFLTLSAKQYPLCKSYHVVSEKDSFESRILLEEIVNKDPKNVECILKLAVVYFQTDEIDKAFDLITKAYRLDPKFVQKQKYLEKVLDTALKFSGLKRHALKNSDIKSWNRLGRQYYDMRFFKEATKAYNNSLKIDPTQIDIKIMLALSYINSNNIDKALIELKSVIQDDPENFYANYHMGKILKNRMKNPSEARAYFEYLEYLIKYKKIKFDKKAERLEFYKKDIKRELDEIKSYFSR